MKNFNFQIVTGFLPIILSFFPMLFVFFLLQSILQRHLFAFSLALSKWQRYSIYDNLLCINTPIHSKAVYLLFSF